LNTTITVTNEEVAAPHVGHLRRNRFIASLKNAFHSVIDHLPQPHKVQSMTVLTPYLL
jgi:hypothetical protein